MGREPVRASVWFGCRHQVFHNSRTEINHHPRDLPRTIDREMVDGRRA